MNAFKLVTIIFFLASCTPQIIVDLESSAISSSDDSETGIDVSQLGASPGNEEWIEVPANAGGMGLNAFAVMKYEAKAFNDANTNSQIDGGEVHTSGMSVSLATNVPVSIADNQPWRQINATDATAKCEALGDNYHLISNEEWMAIAREIESVDTNWTGGSVGSGCIRRGNSGEATSGDGTNLGDSCGYNSTTDPDHGSGRDLRSQHVLSNSSVIFDLAGNVNEWTDWDKDTSGFQNGISTCPMVYTELTGLGGCGMADADYNSNHGGYDSNQGVGKVYGGGIPGATIRGGHFGNSDNAGIYGGQFSMTAGSAVSSIGFRCVYRPL